MAANSSANKSSVDKANLDLLRSVAVTLVVAQHTLIAEGFETWHKLRASDIGLFGVYLFFVHTSLVLMWSLERRPNTLDFYIRRAFRLYPLAIVAILIAAATHAPMAGNTHATFFASRITPRSLLLNCLFVQYLFPNAPIIHGVTWSLAPEMFMYILLPCLFFYARTIRKIWPFLVIWVLVVLMDHSLFPMQVGNNFPILIPDFLAGIIAYVGFMRRKPVLPSWVLLPLLFVLFAGYMCVHHYRADWIACLLLGLILPSIKQFKAKAPARAAHTLATYSYGIYLFHPFTIVATMYLLAGRPPLVQWAAIVIPLMPIVYVGYHAIELPMIRLGARLAARWAKERGLPSEKSLETLEPAP